MISGRIVEAGDMEVGWCGIVVEVNRDRLKALRLNPLYREVVICGAQELITATDITQIPGPRIVILNLTRIPDDLFSGTWALVQVA